MVRKLYLVSGCITGGWDHPLQPWFEHRGFSGVRRGVRLGDLIALNLGREFTFRRGAGRSIIDLKIAAPYLASRIGDWFILDVITLSDHQCIEFKL